MTCLDNPFTSAFQTQIKQILTDFWQTQHTAYAQVPGLAELFATAHTALQEGKRLRPSACVAGWLAAAGTVASEYETGLLQAAASLEMLHISALVHDDVMDSSNLRHGKPAAHIALQKHHTTNQLQGDASSFGSSGAVILGDLLSSWAHQLFTTAPLPYSALQHAQPLWAAVCTEVNLGQFLDILNMTQPLSAANALEQARAVNEYKTSRYTVVRPAQIGAALAGGDPQLLDALWDFGTALGSAFQLRDDILGVFGDSEITGKPVGDDLREGKRTALLAHTYNRANPTEQKLLEQWVGNPAISASQITLIQELMVSTGAIAQVESDIAKDRAHALHVLEHTNMCAVGRDYLQYLVQIALDRQF